jgi:hypothetical protein
MHRDFGRKVWIRKAKTSFILKNIGKFDHAGIFQGCELKSSIFDRGPVAGSRIYG